MRVENAKAGSGAGQQVVVPGGSGGSGGGVEVAGGSKNWLEASIGQHRIEQGKQVLAVCLDEEERAGLI